MNRTEVRCMLCTGCEGWWVKQLKTWWTNWPMRMKKMRMMNRSTSSLKCWVNAAVLRLQNICKNYWVSINHITAWSKTTIVNFLLNFECKKILRLNLFQLSSTVLSNKIRRKTFFFTFYYVIQSISSFCTLTLKSVM